MTAPGRLRAAAASDLDRLAELDRLAFGPEAWPAEFLAEELAAPKRLYLVAQSGAGVVGYAGLYLGDCEAEVLTIAVGGSARRQGWGRALMTALIEAASQAGLQAVRLTVADGLEPAWRLYQSLGFEQIGRAPGYYQASARDGRIMRLTLPPRAAPG